MVNTFDVILLGLLLTGAFFGFQAGIIASLFYVFSGFAGMWAAQTYSFESGLNFYLVFAIGVVAMILLGYILSRMFDQLFLGTIDRLVGAIAIIALSLFIVIMTIMPLSRHLPPKAQSIVATSYSNSYILPYVKKFFPYVKKINLKRLKDYLPF